MFGKKKDKKKSVVIKFVVLESGIPNFTPDTITTVTIDETDNIIKFDGYGNNSASLTLDRLIRIESGSKPKTAPGVTSKRLEMLETLKIVYTSNEGDKEINICETNNYGRNQIELLKVTLNRIIYSRTDAPAHINL